MRVRATKPGFYRRLHKPGSVFLLDRPAQFSARWMEKVEVSGATQAPDTDARKPEPQSSDPVSEDDITAEPETDTCDDAEADEEPPKRKRGRPKKSQSDDNEEGA